MLENPLPKAVLVLLEEGVDVAVHVAGQRLRQHQLEVERVADVTAVAVLLGSLLAVNRRPDGPLLPTQPLRQPLTSVQPRHTQQCLF